MIKRWNSRYLWFKIALSAGLLLSLVLLAQSVLNYYHVSRRMVTEQLTREADRQILALERTLRQSASRHRNSCRRRSRKRSRMPRKRSLGFV